MASRINPSTFGYQNFYSATLTNDITSGTLTIGLDTVPTPTSGILIIDPESSSREVILYTSKGASTITCPSDGRGFSGTSAASHLQGTQVIMAPVDKWFSALASGEASTDPLRTELFYDYVVSGCVWSGDSYGSTRAASMTSGVVYINGRRLTVAAVTGRTFTASVDTYVDFSDNGDGTAAITYSEVSNNNPSQALTTNYLRNAIIVTAAGSIASAGSVNQGQQDKVLPIASSVPYQVTDSIGNLICPRDPFRGVIGYRQITSNATNASSTPTQVTGLSVPIIVPSNRKIKVTAYSSAASTSSAGAYTEMGIWEGTVGSGTRKTLAEFRSSNANDSAPLDALVSYTPSSSSITLNVALDATAGTGTLTASSTRPAYIMVELV